MDDSDLFVSAGQMYSLLNALAVFADDPALGLTIGEKLDLETWPLFKEATKNAQTVGDFFLQFITKSRELASSVEPQLNVDGVHAVFQMRRVTDPGVCPVQADSFYIGLFNNIFMQLLGNNWTPDAVLMHICDTRVVPDKYRNIRLAKGDRLGFRMQFPMSWLLTHSDQLRPVKDSPDTPPPLDLTEAVRQALLPHLHSSSLNITRAAEICGYTPKTLQRKLHEQGTTITREIAELREQHARHLLLHTNRTIADIGFAVGYPEPSAFTRSFKKWTQLSPSAFRKQHRDQNT